MHYAPRGSDLVLDGVTYHRVEGGQVPCSNAEVPVTLDDNGTIVPVCSEFLSLTIAHSEIKARMFAGLVGACVSDSGQPDAVGKPGTRDQLSPAVGWSFFSIHEYNNYTTFSW